MADLKAFLTNLSQDPTLKKNYDADPSKTMSDAGIPDAARQAVLSGDRATIAQHLGGTNPQGIGVSVTVNITLGVSL